MRVKPWMILLGCGIVLVGCAGQTITQVIDDPNFDQEQVWVDGCQTNIRHLGTAFNIYVTDYDDVLPPTNWQAVAPYYSSSRITACPREYIHGQQHFSYAMNEDLLGVNMTSIEDPHNTPLIFEVDADIPYMVADFADILKTPRHKDKIFWASTDSSPHFIGETP